MENGKYHHPLSMFFKGDRVMIKKILLIAFFYCLSSTVYGDVVESEYSVRLKGTMQWWFIYDEFSQPKTTMRLRRAEIILLGKREPYLSWLLMIDPALLREDTDKKGLLLDFIISLKPNKHISLDFGQYRVPFGLEGLELTPLLDFVERASMTTQLKWSAVGDVGFQFTYRLNLNSIESQTTAGLFNGEGGNRTDLNEYKDICARQTIRLFNIFHLGATHYHGRKGTNGIDNFRTGIETKFVKGPVFIQGEFADGKSEGKDRRCYYLSSGYKFSKSIQALVRYDRWVLDKSQPANIETEITLGLNYFLADSAKLQFNHCFRKVSPLDKGIIVRFNVHINI